jgi:(p)ppGpp synthase/HD superfamily hydrolase
MENRETFFARLTPFMPPSELRQVEVAYMMAKFAHRAQTRTELDANGDPVRYFEHLRGVALILIDECEIRDWKLIVAGLLHDSLEDTRDITPEIIEHLFGDRVCQIVKLLSKCPKEGYLERLQKYGDSDTLLVKAADRLHNLRSMKDCTPEFRTKQRVETYEKYFPIFRQNEIRVMGGLMLQMTNAMREIK